MLMRITTKGDVILTLEKDNPNHDEAGRFTSAGVGNFASLSPKDKELLDRINSIPRGTSPYEGEKPENSWFWSRDKIGRNTNLDDRGRDVGPAKPVLRPKPVSPRPAGWPAIRPHEAASDKAFHESWKAEQPEGNTPEGHKIAADAHRTSSKLFYTTSKDPELPPLTQAHYREKAALHANIAQHHEWNAKKLQGTATGPAPSPFIQTSSDRALMERWGKKPKS